MACNRFTTITSRFLAFLEVLMLPKKYRLKNYSSFIATYKINNFVCDENLFVYLGKEKTDQTLPTKVGVVVSKKVHKRAVKRNRIKRLIRESYRLMLKNGEIDFVQNRMSIIIVGRKGALDSDFNAIKNSVFTLLKKFSDKSSPRERI